MSAPSSSSSSSSSSPSPVPPNRRLFSLNHHPITPGRILLSVVATSNAIAPYVADWNATHVLNPRWPPHARFHNGQTMSMGMGLGLSTLYYCWFGHYDRNGVAVD